jgi:hypothetical protein
MSKKIQEQIRYLEVKRKYESSLRKKRALSEVSDPYYADSGLFAAIGDALGDVFKSLKLAAMDISNELRWLGQQFLLRNDRAALEDAGEEFKKRQSKIYQEWEPIMKKNLDAINSTDPMLALALAPGAYMATKGVQAGIAAGKTAAEIVVAEPWSDIRKRISSFDWGDEETGDPAKAQKAQDLGMGAIYDQMRKQNNILFRLEDLFTRNQQAAPQQNETLMREQDQEKSGEKEPEKEEFEGIQSSPEEFVKEFLSLTGIDEQFEDAATASLSGKTRLMSDAIPIIENIRALIRLIQTSDMRDFSKMVGQIVSERKIPESASQGYAKIIPEIEANAKKMADSPEFKEEIAKVRETSVDQISEKEIYDAALNESFRIAKSKFNTDQSKDIGDFIKTIEKNHEEIQIPDSSSDPVIKHAEQRTDLPEAVEFVDVYNRYIESYKELQDAKAKIRL